MSCPPSHNPVSICDSTQCLPPELKGRILALGSRAQLLSTSLVSRDWRSIATADARFFLVIRLSTNECRERRDLPLHSSRLVETCFQRKLWIKLTVSLPFAPEHKWHNEDRMFAKWFCNILRQIMPRAVALHMELSCSIWPMIQQVLVACPAPVLRALNLAWVEGDSSIQVFTRPKITPGIFADQAPFLTSLRLDAFAPSTAPVKALFSIHNFSITLGSDGAMPAGLPPSIVLSNMMPALRNLELSLSPSGFQLYQPLDLRGLGLSSLSLSDDGNGFGSEAIIELGQRQRSSIPLVRRTRATGDFDFNEVMAYLEEINTQIGRNSALPLALNLTMYPLTDTTRVSCYLELRVLDNVGKLTPNRLRSFTFIPDPGPDSRFQQFIVRSLRYSAAQLVSLTIDAVYLVVLTNLENFGTLVRLLRLEVHVRLFDWMEWSVPSSESVRANLPRCMETPALEVVRISAIDGRWRVSPEVVKRIGMTFTRQKNAPPLRLELSGMLVADLPARFDPFEGFGKVVGSLTTITDYADLPARGRDNCFMEQTFHDYSTGSEYALDTESSD